MPIEAGVVIGLTWLVIVAVLASAVSAYYYVRVIYVFWMRSPEEVPEAQQVDFATMPAPPALSATVLVVCAVALLVLFVGSGGVIGFADSFFAEAGGMAALP